MLITIFSIILILFGGGLIFFTIKEYDRTKSNKYNRIENHIYLGFGLFYVIIGSLIVLKIISGKYIIFAVILFTILEIFIKQKLNQRIK
ncbi:hypothetical protein SDC9_125959 [bioreactor metagenome]|uniref:Uncharacterized protein n=1 Tax=bioreactor metagenome TaxID=1076179 RepID=A0A645CPY9_9ZZZZ